MKKFALPSLLLFMAVLFGAFGAHGLEGKITEKALKTFKTGNLYHFFHAFGLFFILILEEIKNIKLKREVILILLGLLLFSGCCYLYALTSIKLFAMIVPVGGISYLLAWLSLFLKCIKN